MLGLKQLPSTSSMFTTVQTFLRNQRSGLPELGSAVQGWVCVCFFSRGFQPGASEQSPLWKLSRTRGLGFVFQLSLGLGAGFGLLGRSFVSTGQRKEGGQ